MNEKAQTLAKWWSRFLPYTVGGMNCLHIYLNGYVVVADGGSDRHLAIRDVLKSIYPGFEEARSVDGSFSIFLIPADDVPARPQDVNMHLYLMTMKGGYHDHRIEDYNRIEYVLLLADATLRDSEVPQTPADPAPGAILPFQPNDYRRAAMLPEMEEIVKRRADDPFYFEDLWKNLGNGNFVIWEKDGTIVIEDDEADDADEHGFRRITHQEAVEEMVAELWSRCEDDDGEFEFYRSLLG